MKELSLTSGQFALIDDVDYDKVSSRRWHAYKSSNSWYCRTNIGKKHISLHAFLFPVPKGFVVDHIDGNGLNNQRANLRQATQAENMRNQRPHRDSRSPYKGIWRIPGAKTWGVQIWNGRKRNYVGSFVDPLEAAKVYDFIAIQVFGQFAKVNGVL